MSLCQSIDTLAMAYLDDELVTEERRELELHLLSCAACKQHVEGERADLSFVRKALLPPPAPPALRASIQRLLDDEDRQAARSVRQRWTRFLLPGSAALAAAAALVVFVAARPPAGDDPASAVTHVVVGQTQRQKPLEVQGAATGPWLQRHFQPRIEPPQFTEPGIRLLGARLTDVAGHDGALLRYEVSLGGRQFPLTAVVLDGLRGNELSGGAAVKVGDRVLYVHEVSGTPVVAFVDSSAAPGARIGYVFACDHATAQELLELVVSSDLVSRAGSRR